jgi:TniQ
MLSSVARGLPKPRRWSDSFKVGIALTGNRKVARRLVALSGLSPSTLTSLRPARTGWDLPRQEFRAYCPRCCLDDLHRGETPYGRLVWQQAWYTVCRVHRIPLLLRRTTSAGSWTRHQLQEDATLAAALGYQHAKQPQRERFYIQYALLELQAAIEGALASVRPRRRQWGVVSTEHFLHVLEDVTTWSLTHFETVRSWSLAEDLTPIEIADGLKLLGRHRRMTPADYAGDRAARSLVDVEDPAVRGSALWFAHSVMASYHQDASDRQTAYRRTSRQEIKYAASPPAARAWLASRMRTWPERYRSKCWLNPQS